MVMLSRRSIVATALAAVLGMVGSAQAFDGPKYPEWEGQWRGFFSPELSANGPGQAFAGWDQTISRLGGSWRGFFSPELSANGPGQAFAGWDQTISRLGGSWRGFFSPELSANGPGQAFAGW